MAFTHATGKHRGSKVRVSRRLTPGAGAAGVAGLAAVGVVGSLASPALASVSSDDGDSTRDTGLTQAVGLGDSLADTITEQAQSQKAEAEQAKLQKAAKKRAAEAQRKAAAEKAKRTREAQERADRAEAKRAKLNPYVAPVDNSYISTGYKTGGGLWSSGSHTGIDFHAAQGTPVKSVAAGEVVEAGNGGAYGNNIVIKHKDGTYTQYGHLSSIGVSVGQSVASGERIGLSGATGNVTGPHLHFEARTSPDYGSDMDPVAYLRQHGVKV